MTLLPERKSFLSTLQKRQRNPVKKVVEMTLSVNIMLINKNKQSDAFSENKTLLLLVCLLGMFVLVASFLLRRRLFVISTRPNISDRFWSRLTKIGGWEEKCQQYLIRAVKTQTKVGFTKQGVPVSFHQSKRILG